MTFDTVSEPRRRYDSGDFPFDGPTPARVWGDHWLRVNEKVLKGLNHKLTNRVAALEAVVTIFDPAEGPDPELVQALAAEVRQLHELLRLFRLMPAEPFAEAEACRLQDVMPQVLQLHGHHADLKEIAFELHEDKEACPILVRQSALLRCLLVVLEAAAGNALRSGVDHPLQISYTQHNTDVVISIAGPATPSQLIFSDEGSLIHAVRTALAHAHASVDGHATPMDGYDRVRYELRLPTLAEARRLEREAAL
jgi:hypothetical protein